MCQGSIRPSGLVKSTNEGSINKEDCAYKPFLNHLCAILIVIAHKPLIAEALCAIFTVIAHKLLILETLCTTTNCTAHISLDPEALYAITLNVIYRRIYPAPHPLVSSDSRGLPGHLPSPCSCPRGFNSPRRSARGSWGRP